MTFIIINLTISYKKEIYKNYLSIFFYITIKLGIKIINKIEILNYNTLDNKFITINDALKMNKSLLFNLSKISQKYLIKNNYFNNKEMLIEKTKPIKNNYNNFIITKEGIIFFFEVNSKYLKVTIPFKYLKKIKRFRPFY